MLALNFSTAVFLIYAGLNAEAVTNRAASQVMQLRESLLAQHQGQTILVKHHEKQLFLSMKQKDKEGDCPYGDNEGELVRVELRTEKNQQTAMPLASHSLIITAKNLQRESFIHAYLCHRSQAMYLDGKQYFIEKLKIRNAQGKVQVLSITLHRTGYFSYLFPTLIFEAQPQ